MGSPVQAASRTATTNGNGSAPVDVGPTRGTSTPRAAWGLPLILAFVATACIGFNTTRLAGFPLADVLFLATAGFVAAALLMGDTRDLAPAPMRRAPTQLVGGSLLLLGAGVWSTLWVAEPGASTFVIVRFAWLTLVWSWLLRTVAANRLAVDRLIAGYRIAVWISATLAIAGDFGLVHMEHGTSGRQGALTGHPNHLGGLLAIGLPFFLLDTRATEPDGKRPWSRSLAFRLLSSGYVVFALTTTGSMTALGAALAGIAVMLAARALARGSPRRKHGPLVAIGVTLVVFLGVAGLVASGAPTIERFIHFTEGRAAVSSSVEGRGEQDSLVVDNLHRYLLMGVGFNQGDNEIEEQTGHYIHNNVLRLLYEAGVPAVAGILMLWLLAVRQCWRLLFNTRGTSLHRIVLALLASLVTATAFSQFHPLAYERYYWFPLVMIGATWSLRRHELKTERSAQGTPTV
jgi:hypothetical protein